MLTHFCDVVPLYSCDTAAVTSADTRCHHKTIFPLWLQPLTAKPHYNHSLHCQYAPLHHIQASVPLSEHHTRSRPAGLRLCRDDPDGGGFHEVPVEHLVLLGPGQRLQLRGRFWAPVYHELILGLAVVHHHLLRLLPKQPVWKNKKVSGQSVKTSTFSIFWLQWGHQPAKSWQRSLMRWPMMA